MVDLSDPSVTDQIRCSESYDIQNITEALDSWAQRIIDAETEYSRTASLHQKITDSIQRQLLGFVMLHLHANCLDASFPIVTY